MKRVQRKEPSKMGLKQKIEEKIVRTFSIIRDYEDHPTIDYSQKRWVELDQILSLLDDATRQIQEKIKEQEEIAKQWKNDIISVNVAEFETLGDVYESFIDQIYSTWLVYVSANSEARALKDVLAVLVGEEAKTT